MNMSVEALECADLPVLYAWRLRARSRDKSQRAHHSENAASFLGRRAFAARGWSIFVFWCFCLCARLLGADFPPSQSKQTNDPLYFGQWSLLNTGFNGALPRADINAPGAWTNLAGNPGIVIALLDDGVQLDHPDLAANLFSNPGETSNGLDDDGNGYVDDLHGWDFFRDDNDPSPEFPGDQHGTA